MATDAPRVAADARAERRIARLARVGTWLVRALGATWRIRVRNDEPVLERRVAKHNAGGIELESHEISSAGTDKRIRWSQVHDENNTVPVLGQRYAAVR